MPRSSLPHLNTRHLQSGVSNGGGRGDCKRLPWASTWHMGWLNPPRRKNAEDQAWYFSSLQSWDPILAPWVWYVWEITCHNLQPQTRLRQSWQSLWENSSAIRAMETRDHVLFGLRDSNPLCPSQRQLWDSPGGAQWHKSYLECLRAVDPCLVYLWLHWKICRFAKIKIKEFLHSQN